MNKELSTLNKQFQELIKKEDTFLFGIEKLLELRREINFVLNNIFENCSNEDFCKMPLITDKTIAYYIWHMNRIEDITSNTLINNSPEILFMNHFDKKINSRITTTGNELTRNELVEFSRDLNLMELRNYMNDVYNNTNKIIKALNYQSLKTKISSNVKEKLLELNVVSTDKNAFWLVDYWCNKDYLGLMKMPFSRHLIMHLEGSLRICNKLQIEV